LAPEYKKAAEKLAGMVIVGAVDCDADQNKGLCATYGIQGFPTIKVFSAGVKGMPSDYQGPRTAAAIVKEGISKVRSYLRKCDALGFDDLVATNNKSVMVLISEKAQVPVMFKALSAEFHNQVDFCFFKSSDEEFVKKVEIKAFPSLLLFSKEKDPVVYNGPQKFKAIKEFLEPYAVNRKTKGNSKKEQGKKEAPKEKPVCNILWR
jgi:protein disulfide-isomerase A6